MNERAGILLEMLGQRLKQTRLNADRTQQEVADIIGMSRTAIEGAEKGKCNLSTFASILLALDATDQLDLFLPEPPPSPVLLAKAKGRKRQRASAAKAQQTSPQRDELEW